MCLCLCFLVVVVVFVFVPFTFPLTPPSPPFYAMLFVLPTFSPLSAAGSSMSVSMGRIQGQGVKGETVISGLERKKGHIRVRME